ncbi:MAG: hypothetical protein ABMB14_40135 [Myxococcota bacterium]
MPIRRDQPYAAEHRKVLDFLDRLTAAENEALLRRSGILDDQGHLAAKYRAGGEPVNGVELASTGATR